MVHAWTQASRLGVSATQPCFVEHGAVNAVAGSIGEMQMQFYAIVAGPIAILEPADDSEAMAKKEALAVLARVDVEVADTF